MSDLRPEDDDVAVDANAEAIRRGHDEKIRAIKHALIQWAEANQRPGNHGTIILALLELGIERHLEHFDEKSAADLIQGVLRKVLRRRLGTLQ
jgi:hypothetical protein